VTMALLNYPMLMAADILIYHASRIPVGIDQEPHIEVAREVARRMNQLYGTDFPEPQRFETSGGYVPSLTGEGKMSKSVAGSYINLTDDLDTIRHKVRSVPTATAAGGVKSPGVQALFTYLELVAPTEVARFETDFRAGTLRFVDLKDTVAEAIYRELAPIQARRAELQANPSYVDSVIREGARFARDLAEPTVADVKARMGLG
jgi:tryptophanyl-tRNA synthetase